MIESGVNAVVSRKVKLESPESRWFAAHKNKRIKMWFIHPGASGKYDEPLIGYLIWVDVFSIGVQLENNPNIQLIYKHAISGLELAE